MPNLVATLVLSEECRILLPWVLPRHQAYAQRMGADYLVRGRAHPELADYWERLALGEMLAIYDRLLILDADTLVRGDCPNLFEVVPPRMLGMSDDAYKRSVASSTVRERNLRACYEHYGWEWRGWSGVYCNVGVMVCSRYHAPLLEVPDDEWVCDMNEQDIVNARCHYLPDVWPLMDLGWKYNRTPDHGALGDCPADPQEAYIIHYAGARPFDERAERMAEDDEAWRCLGL